MPKKYPLVAISNEIQRYWDPLLLGEVNQTAIKLAKFNGEFCWHHHETEDELFLVVLGRLEMQFRTHTEVLGPGELIIVPKGVEHCPKSDQETLVLLVEPSTTLNTGNVNNELTRSTLRQYESGPNS